MVTTATPAAKPRKPRVWYRVWLSALAHPRSEGFAALLRDPGAGVNRALGLIAAATAIGMLLMLLEARALKATAVLCYTPSAVLVGVVGFVVYTSITHGIVRLTGGKALYRDLIYLYAAYYAPLLIVSAALLPVPVLRWAALGLALLALSLNVFAIRTSLSRGASTTAVAWLPALVGGLWPAALILVLLALILAAGSVTINM